MSQSFITNPLTKRSVKSAGNVARKVYNLYKAGELECSDRDIAILDRLFGSKKPEIIYTADFPELPMHIIERIVYKASGTCREYVQNKLVGKEFNTEPYQVKNDGFEDAEDFFEYTVGTRTLNQLKNPESNDDIACAKQFMPFFEAELEKNAEFLDDFTSKGSTVATRARQVNLLVYNVIIGRFVRNTLTIICYPGHTDTLATIVDDSDSLRDIRDKLRVFMAHRKLSLAIDYIGSGQDRLFIR